MPDLRTGMTFYRKLAATGSAPFRDTWWAGDACSRCDGRGEVPKVPGDYRVVVPCRHCRGTGRRGPR